MQARNWPKPAKMIKMQAKQAKTTKLQVRNWASWGKIISARRIAKMGQNNKSAGQKLGKIGQSNPPETHKRRKTEALEVPSDLQDMEIPLEDMGDVIVLTGL